LGILMCRDEIAGASVAFSIGNPTQPERRLSDRSDTWCARHAVRDEDHHA
jgi:hypothetical protein